MTRFSDAALLRGKFSHMAAELRQGKREAPKPEEWSGVACENTAEKAAQEVAKHIFAFQQSIDAEKEALEIIAVCPAGGMKVMALIPGDGDILRLDGLLMPDGIPTSTVMHASQLALSFIRRPLENNEADDDGLQIGFVIFDELAERKKSRGGTEVLEDNAQTGDEAE